MGLKASEIDAHVGRRMRQRREALGLSQGALGRHLGLTFSQVQKYEKGTNRIGAGRLFLLSQFLGAPLQYFFEGLDESVEEPGTGRSAADERELEAIQTAYLSISDPETRNSILALLCSLAPGDARARKAGGSWAPAPAAATSRPG
jgi:transcriptional regulator with XRE-family HTH domain